MALKKNDFVELGYTGKIKEDGFIFDTTDEKLAKEHGIHSPKTAFGPAIVCLGEGHLLPGLERRLIGLELGRHTIELSAEEAFGKKSAALIQLIPISKFRKQQITPVPGLHVNVDGQPGIIKTVSGGRVLVDFNHPLSGKDIIYEIDAIRVVTDDAEKLKAMLALQLGLKEPEVELQEGTGTVFLPQELPEELSAPLSESLQKLTGLKKVKFVKKAQPGGKEGSSEKAGQENLEAKQERQPGKDSSLEGQAQDDKDGKKESASPNPDPDASPT